MSKKQDVEALPALREMYANCLTDPAEFNHVVYLLENNSRDVLADLLDTLIDDARVDLSAHADDWDLNDRQWLLGLTRAIRPPGDGEVFSRCVLNTLEDAAARWLLALLAARNTFSMKPSLEEVIATGRELMLERQNAMRYEDELQAAREKARNRESSRIGGSTPKGKPWAEKLARRAVRAGKAPRAAWDALPTDEPDEPNVGEWIVWRRREHLEAERMVARNDRTGDEDSGIALKTWYGYVSRARDSQ
jgi:hypothetical protein